MQTTPVAIAAIDLGATSGRVMLGIAADGRVELEEARRFGNELRERDGHLTWDVDALWGEIRQGLTAADRLARERGLDGLSSIGIDSWAVDYVLIGPDAPGSDGSPVPGTGERIGEAIAYRDARTDGVPERVAQRVDREQQFAITGIAQQPFNTIYQLAADERLAPLPAGSTALLLPDYLAYLLTGARRTETTNASTTGLFDARERDWSAELCAAIGVEPALFAPLIEAGERVGTVRPALAAELGIGELPVVAIGSHDTASAVLAVPADTEPVAYISSGTWSLVGLELDEPILTDEVRRAGFTNEGGVAGTIRFLQNVMGMWLVSECRRQWDDEGAPAELAELLAQAAEEPAGRFTIDATDPGFLPPGNMADRVAAAARPAEGGDARPDTPAQIARCILDSLALAYRDAVERACELARIPRPETLHVVGGGSRNALLNQLTADALGLEVVAGPVEATALGNIAVQARTLGAIGEQPGAVRELVRASVELERFTPSGRRSGIEASEASSSP